MDGQTRYNGLPGRAVHNSPVGRQMHGDVTMNTAFLARFSDRTLYEDPCMGQSLQGLVGLHLVMVTS
jgi:hypothetical protein